MNPQWLRLAGSLLQTASETFSNHGCNDWKWPADWSLNERIAFAEQMVSQNMSRPITEFNESDRQEMAYLVRGEYGPPDWWVMSFLATELSK